MKEIPSELEQMFRHWEETLPGWCFLGKMRVMAALTLAERPKLCVELGVYGGRSALPVAATLRHVGSGLLVAIDPYSNAAAGEGTQRPSEDWWRTAELEGVMRTFLQTVRAADLDDWLEFRRERSQDALSRFADGTIDCIHVDGNHSPEVALTDVSGYWPKIRAGGFLILDDTDWPSLAPAMEWLDGVGAQLVKDYERFRLYRKPAG